MQTCVDLNLIQTLTYFKCLMLVILLHQLTIIIGHGGSEVPQALDSNDYDDIARAALFNSLVSIGKFAKSSLSSGDKVSKEHFRYLNWRINSYLEG